MAIAKANKRSYRRIIATIALVASVYFISPPFANFKNAYLVYQNTLGNGYQAICPSPGSSFYQLVTMDKERHTVREWVQLISDGPPRNQRIIAFYVRPQPLGDDASVSFSSEPIETRKNIAFQVRGGAYDAAASMTFNGGRFLLDGFGVVNGDSPEPFSARKVKQSLSEIADAIHHCSPSASSS